MLINALPRKSTKVKKFKNNSVFSEILLFIFENTKSRIPYLDQLWYGRPTTRDRQMEKLTKDLNAAINTTATLTLHSDGKILVQNSECIIEQNKHSCNVTKS